MVDPLNNFLFQQVLHDWCNKGRGMYNPVCAYKKTYVAAAVSSRYLSGPLPYNRK